MERNSRVDVYTAPTADLGVQKFARPRARLWLVIGIWLFAGPTLAFLSANVAVPGLVVWAIVLCAWIASLVWVIRGYRNAFGPSFTAAHMLAVGLGLTVGIAILAAGGVASLLAALSDLPGL